MTRSAVLMVLTACIAALALAQTAGQTVFNGLPNIKVSEGGTERVVEDVAKSSAGSLRCRISKVGDRFFWTSRDNKELVELSGAGAFVTYVAIDGSGYVRLTRPSMKAAASLMGPTEAKFDYAEHLLIGLRSVTYYGTMDQ